MEEAQAAIHGNSHRLESSQEDGSSGYFSTVDWNYVIVEQDLNILNQEYYESVAIHDQKELFGFLNRLIKETKNRMENFWIERGHEFNFFKAFNTNVRANGQLSYPADSVMGAGRRISATQSTILKIYKKNVPPETGMAFLDKNQILWDVDTKRKDRIKKILKTSTVYFIMYLSLFREHEGDQMKGEHIIGLMEVAKEFIRNLQAKESLGPGSEDDIQQIWHDLIHSRPRRSDSTLDLTTAWKTAIYCINVIRKSANSESSPSTIKIDYQWSAQQVIHKIIFFSNLKTFHTLVNSHDWGFSHV
jgi:hypothetical protein